MNRNELVNDLEIPAIPSNFEFGTHVTSPRSFKDRVLDTSDAVDLKTEFKKALVFDKESPKFYFKPDIRRMKLDSLQQPFSPEHLEKLEKFAIKMEDSIAEESFEHKPLFDEKYIQNLREFFDEECRVFEDNGSTMHPVFNTPEAEVSNKKSKHVEKSSLE